MLKRWRLPIGLFVLGVAGYMAVSRLAFHVPASLLEGEACGFTAADFVGGQLQFSAGAAWWVSFLRKQEFLSALSIGMVVAFVGFAIASIRQIGAGVASGAVAGGGVLAVLSLCLSCLAPALSAIGLGLFSNLSLAIPKWLMTVNTVALTSWGFLFLSRRATACPINLAAARKAQLASR